MKLSGSSYAFFSAFLFAAGMPATKQLLQYASPVMLAAILYIGSGIASSLILLFKSTEIKNSFSKVDIARMLTAITLGGICAPLSLMMAMQAIKASTVSLLLNFEIVFTAIIAAIFFKEHLSIRIIIGLISVFSGGVCLSFNSNLETSWAFIYAIAAAFLWSVDANITARITTINPLEIVRSKGLIAGAFNLVVALLSGATFPTIDVTLWAMLTGFMCYGMSLVFFIESMRRLGAARATSLFATEPFIGAILCVIFLHEQLTFNLILAGILMSAGVALHLSDNSKIHI